jgi:hypothetical protein
LRDAYIDEAMRDHEPGDVATDYPDIVEVYDEYEGEEPTGWEVDGETFDNYEAAQARADAIADERNEEGGPRSSRGRLPRTDRATRRLGPSSKSRPVPR